MTPPDLHITQFTYKHANIFSKLRIATDRESDHVLANKNERTENALHVIVRLLISQRRIVTFLAFDGKEAIGYVSLVFPKYTKLKGNAYLTIAIREKYRGKGVGTKLMDKAEQYAKEKGIRRIELEVFGKNKNAIAMYEKRGYLTEGAKKDAVDGAEGFDDIIFMAKKLK